MSQNPFLISPDELASHLGKPGLSVVDASWYLPAQKRLAEPEFETAHIPGAVFFDQDAIVDPASSLPHTLPSAADFGAAAGRLGIRETDTIVVYDGMGLFSAPRVWWMFRTYGAKDVRILDGGFPAWRAGNHPVETGKVSPEPASFEASFDADAVATLDEMRQVVDDGSLQVVDARPADRFAGEAAEPRPGVRAGHMPGARNLPFLQLAENGRLKSPADLRAAFAAAGVDPDAPVVTSCGSGVTAAVLNLALETLGSGQHRLYDGSWTEWGGATDTPVVTGP
ncbi:3-mercaptopyruvate sulfurtransferase [Aurantimonas coralicida]|uniref:3-mercaptopyruvate sulfurtransferase n=1 Tax=Aurantimonas coralicida TaxID=182270 RepID=UPI001E49C170|nr:3-mercaptopyruvate sulfurtransferase [Aurantimonas coralicida]MCD1643403.1 3-mercaptopyruvate sulfurtransferase [Aurantimonas coralicida]